MQCVRAGSTADAFSLLDRLEKKLDEHPGQLARSCVELAKAWRTDKYLRRLEAVLLVADRTQTFELTGTGDVLEPSDGIMGVGSGGHYALAAARALARRVERPLDHSDARDDRVRRKGRVCLIGDGRGRGRRVGGGRWASREAFYRRSSTSTRGTFLRRGEGVAHGQDLRSFRTEELTGTGGEGGGIMGVGSGGHYGWRLPSSRDIATRAMAVAADAVLYTNTPEVVPALRKSRVYTGKTH